MKDPIVPVKKKEVLAALVKARDAHVKEHADLQASWVNRMRKPTEDLNTALNSDTPQDLLRIRQTARELWKVESARPTLETDRYNEVIAMLEHSVDNTVALDQEQFRAYMNDEWEWKKEWLETSTCYAGCGR